MRSLARVIELVERPGGCVDLVVVADGVSVVLGLDACQADTLGRRLTDGAPPALEAVAR